MIFGVAAFTTLLITMANVTGAEVPSPFVAIALKVNVPAAVGVPDIVPLLSNVSPVGSVPVAFQLVGLLVAARVTL